MLELFVNWEKFVLPDYIALGSFMVALETSIPFLGGGPTDFLYEDEQLWHNCANSLETSGRLKILLSFSSCFSLS